MAEKELLINTAVGSAEMTDALGELIRFVGHAELSPAFDGDLVERFLDKVTVSKRNEVIFHLKCGLDLTERIGKT